MGNGASGPPEGAWRDLENVKLRGPKRGENQGFSNGKQPMRSPKDGSRSRSFGRLQNSSGLILPLQRGSGPGQSQKRSEMQARRSLSNFLTAASSFAVGKSMKEHTTSNDDAGPAKIAVGGSPFGGAVSPPALNNLAGFRNSSILSPPKGGRVKKMRMRVGADEYDDGETPYDYDSESPPPLEPRSPKGSLNSTVAAPRDVGDGNHQRGHFLPIQAATEAAAGTAAAARAEANARAKEDMAATAAVTLKEKTYDGFKVPRVNHYQSVGEACKFLRCDPADLEYAEVSEDTMEGADGRFWMVIGLTLAQQNPAGNDHADAHNNDHADAHNNDHADAHNNDHPDAHNNKSRSSTPPPPPLLGGPKEQGLWRLRSVGVTGPGVASTTDRCRDGRVDLPHNAVVDFITDVEGQWAYFEKLVNLSDILFWNEEGELDLKMNGYLVHGGDSTDKGCGDIQVVKALIGLKQRYPDRVFLILGNRDVNKLRFTSELVPGRDGALVNVFWDAKHVPFAKWLEIGKRPTSKRIQTLQWILECTMGCQTTFETRRTELAMIEQLHVDAAYGIDSNDGNPIHNSDTNNYNNRGGNGVVDPSSITDEAVYESFIKSVDPSPDAEDPWMLRYLELGQVALVLGDTLFVHGAVNKAALQFVPGWSAPAPGGLLGWVAALNKWAASEVGQYKATSGVYNPSGVRAGEQLLAYFLPLPPAHPMAGKTCIYNDGFVKGGKYVDPQPAVSVACNAAGVTRLMVGHLPRGECPAVILNGLRTLLVVISDTSYSDMAASKERNPADNRGLAHALVSLTATTTQIAGVVSDGSSHSAVMQYPARRNSSSLSKTSTRTDLDGLAMELGLELTRESADACVGLELIDGSRVKTVLRSGKDAGKLIVAVDERRSGENRLFSTELHLKPTPSQGGTATATPGGGSIHSFDHPADPHFNARADELSAMLATAFDGIWGKDTPSRANGAGGPAVAATTIADGADGKLKKRASNKSASRQWSCIRAKHTNAEWREMLQSTVLDLQYDFGYASEEAAADAKAHREALAAALAPPDGTLAAAQHHVLENLKEKLRPLPIASEKFNRTLKRFLAARGYHVGRAESAVRAHIAWHAATFPIRSSEFAADPFFRKCGIFQFGRDLGGRPIIVLKGSSFCPKERGAALCERGVIYVIESLVAQFESIDTNNSSTFSIIFDLEGFTTSKHLDRELIKRIFTLLGNHYPQRLHQVFFSPCSWKFKLAGWPLLRSCMDSQSRAVAVLLKTKADLLKYVEPEQLEESLGGTSTFLPQPFDLNAEPLSIGVANPW